MPLNIITYIGFNLRPSTIIFMEDGNRIVFFRYSFWLSGRWHSFNLVQLAFCLLRQRPLSVELSYIYISIEKMLQMPDCRSRNKSINSCAEYTIGHPVYVCTAPNGNRSPSVAFFYALPTTRDPPPKYSVHLFAFQLFLFFLFCDESIFSVLKLKHIIHLVLGIADVVNG